MASELEEIMLSTHLLQPQHQNNYLFSFPHQYQNNNFLHFSGAVAGADQQQQQPILFSLKPSLLHFPSTTTSSPSSSLWDVGESFMRGRNWCGGGGGGGGDGDNNRKLGLRVSTAAATMKRIKGRKKVREPRFCFKTMSDVDVLDDGYKWRKYGQKVVKNTLHPRSYYRCTQDNCRVKKRVERLAEDPRMVITTYEGRHAHSPSPDNLEETMGSLPSGCLNNFFW